MFKDSKGVTLITLVVTIAVMLILVGVTIYAGINSGLISHSKDLSGGVEYSNVKENIKMDILAEKNTHGKSTIKYASIEKILKKYVESPDTQLIYGDVELENGEIVNDVVTKIKLNRNRPGDYSRRFTKRNECRYKNRL